MEDLSDISFLGKLLVLPTKVKLDWKVIVRYKHSILFGLIICSEEKKLYNIDARCQRHKTFFFVADKEAKRAGGLGPGKLFLLGLIFVVKVRSLP